MTLEIDILVEGEEMIHELMILYMMYIFWKKNLIGLYVSFLFFFFLTLLSAFKYYHAV